MSLMNLSDSQIEAAGFGDSSYSPDFVETRMNFHFPEMPSPLTPFGERVLVQFPALENKTKSGIILTAGQDKSFQFTQHNAKIVALGERVFKFQNNVPLGSSAPEPMFKVGDIIRVPAAGDRIEYQYIDENGVATVGMFGLFRWYDIIARVDADIRHVRTFY